jgi:hypothetical protein
MNERWDEVLPFAIEMAVRMCSRRTPYEGFIVLTDVPARQRLDSEYAPQNVGPSAVDLLVQCMNVFVRRFNARTDT